LPLVAVLSTIPNMDYINQLKKYEARNKALIRMRDKGATFTEIGNTFNISRQRAQALYNKYKDTFK